MCSPPPDCCCLSQDLPGGSSACCRFLPCPFFVSPRLSSASLVIAPKRPAIAPYGVVLQSCDLLATSPPCLCKNLAAPSLNHRRVFSGPVLHPSAHILLPYQSLLAVHDSVGQLRFRLRHFLPQFGFGLFTPFLSGFTDFKL